MKTFKLTKGIQVALVTICIIILAVMIVGKLSNIETMASDLAPDCPNCGTSDYMKCTKNNKQQHTWSCENEGCDYTLQEEHVNGTHENGGHCQACGYQYQEHTIVADEAKYYVDQSDDMKIYHWKYYPCTAEGCTYQYNTTREVHSGGEQCESKGICEKCGTLYIEHGKSDELDHYEVTDSAHIPVYKCIVDGCTNTFVAEEEAENHSLQYMGCIDSQDGSTHKELYVCSVEGCDYEETSFATSHVFDREYIDNGDGYHNNTCKECGANVTELHTYEDEYTDNGDGTHSNKCEKCGHALTESHNLTTFVDNGDGTHSSRCVDCDYVITENHEQGLCTDNGDGTHSSQCEYCNYVITENHEQEPYTDNGDGTHSSQCKDCNFVIIGEHIPTPCIDNGDGTHSIQCEECNYVLTENHNYETYTDNGNGTHSSVCIDGCGYVLTENHKGAEHSNGGKCTANGCEVTYETHEKSTTISSYTNITDTTHTPIYSCSHEGCAETYEGETEAHNYQNGKCACGHEENHEEEVGEIEITSEKYELNNTYISKVQPGTTINQFKSGLQTNATEINIYNNNNELLGSSDKIGTGMKIELKNANQTKTFTVIVKGDATGDGESDFKDLLKVNQARLNKTTLGEVYSLAADVTEDGNVDFKDLLKINKFRLNKVTEL